MDHLVLEPALALPAGLGDFDLAAFMDALQPPDYEGYLSLEIFNDRFRAGSARSCARLPPLADLASR